jgi:hypothetical protein
MKPNRNRPDRDAQPRPSKQDRRAVNLRGRASWPPSRAVREAQRRRQ